MVKRTEKAEPKSAKKPKPEPTPGHSWTAGDKYKTLAGGCLIAALLLSGPAAIALIAMQPAAVAAPTQLEQDTRMSEVQQRASGSAADFIASWLAATEEDHDEFDRFGAKKPTSFPPSPTATKDLRVLTVVTSETDESQLIVTVGALVKTSDGTWVRSYYSVPMLAIGDQVRPVSLPAQVSIPAPLMEGPSARYSVQATGSINETVSGFFESYLTGAGELDRLLTPGYSLNPIEPAPFSGVKLSELRATDEIADQPADGDTAELQATVITSPRSDRAGPTTSYTLSMTARAGRWEVSALNPYPTLSDSSVDESADITETE